MEPIETISKLVEENYSETVTEPNKVDPFWCLSSKLYDNEERHEEKIIKEKGSPFRCLPTQNNDERNKGNIFEEEKISPFRCQTILDNDKRHKEINVHEESSSFWYLPTQDNDEKNKEKINAHDESSSFWCLTTQDNGEGRKEKIIEQKERGPVFSLPTKDKEEGRKEITDLKERSPFLCLPTQDNDDRYKEKTIEPKESSPSRYLLTQENDEVHKETGFVPEKNSTFWSLPAQDNDKGHKETVMMQEEAYPTLVRSYSSALHYRYEENYNTANVTKEPTTIVLNERVTHAESWGGGFDNPCFYEKGKLSRPGHTSSANVVEEVVQQQLRNDAHPFGRTFYRRSIGACEQTSIHQKDGVLFMWALVTIIIIAVAVGVIAMSQMYHATRHHHFTPKLDSNISTNTALN